MFADDSTLVAKSRKSLQVMLGDLILELGGVGLKPNADKCSIQCSRPSAGPRRPLHAYGMDFKVGERDEGFKVLGTVFTLNGNTKAEFDSRMDAAWAKFHQLKPLVCKRDACGKKRLQLFEASVSKSALWCAESWTLTVRQKRRIRSTQRAMLRAMFGPGRIPNEDYLSWIKRATKAAEARARQAGMQCWLRRQLSMKWAWAGKIIRMEPERWARRMTTWRDSI